jgi:hypothetical protein
MECRRIEKLIPLYVEGDLDIEQTERVRSHAKSCANCSGLIAEYKESQSWLRTFAPPGFDDALFDDLKPGVLEKINEQKTQPPFLNRLAEHWTRRLVLATSVALLIVFGSIAFYIYQNNRNTMVAESEVEQEEQEEQSPEIASEVKDVEKAPRANFSPKRHRRIASSRRRVVARRHTNPEHIVERPVKTMADPAVAIETGGGLSVDPAASQEMLRIHIQTSDPNIRIIWFSPKETDSNPSRPITETE